MNNSTDILRKHYVNTAVGKEAGEAYFALLNEVPTFIALPPYAPGQTGDDARAMADDNQQPD
jgi:hypothetical protein